MSYTEYIRNNFRVEDKATDLPIIYNSFKTISDIKKLGGSDFGIAIEDLWGKKLTRQDVFDIFKKDLYKGYVAAMLWGGLGADGNTKKSFSSAMGYSRVEIESRLNDVLSLYNNGNIEIAFKSFLPSRKGQPEYGSNKINGVGVSYFTKILYFLAPLAAKPLPVTPLIYDKWGWHIHAEILLERGNLSEALTYFNIMSEIKEKKGEYYLIPSVLLKNNNATESAAYMSYLKCMDGLSRTIEGCYPGRLEEFLFGYSRKTNHSLDNPRVRLMDFLSEHIIAWSNEKDFGRYSESIGSGKAKDTRPKGNKAVKNRVSLGDRKALQSTALSINGRDFLLIVGKNGKGLHGNLDHYCALITEQGHDIREALGADKLRALSSLLPDFPKKAKTFIFNDNVTTLEGSLDLYDKVKAILSR